MQLSSNVIAPCWLRGCKNRTHSVSWPEVVKAVANQDLDCFVSYGSFFCFSFVFLVYVVLCLIVFGCQYQCNWLPGKTRLRMTYYVSSGTLNPTHSLAHSQCVCLSVSVCLSLSCSVFIVNYCTNLLGDFYNDIQLFYNAVIFSWSFVSNYLSSWSTTVWCIVTTAVMKNYALPLCWLW